MEPLSDQDRLDLVERAQLLHDSTLRRHGDMLDYQGDTLERHTERIAHLEALMATQVRLQQELQGISDRLTTTMEAIKDLLNRGNGLP